MPENLLNVETVRDLIAFEAQSGRSFLAALLESFAHDARAALERMRACARAGDGERVANEAHRLKGSSGSIGAVGFSSECLAIERNAREGAYETLEERIDQALRVLDASRLGLQRLIPHHAGR